ncbi:MAG: LptA/OstA family protein [Caulobacterales bacterium]
MKRCQRATVMVAAIGLGGLASMAAAQISQSSNGPIDITADQADALPSKCETTWSGAAEALQGQSRLRANVIRAYLKPEGVGPNGQAKCGATDRLEADGNVFYVTPTQTARGDHAVYSAGTDLIVLTGNVIVVQGQNVARGDRLTINSTTHEAQMVSAAKGRGTPGRVRGVFYPNQPGEPPLAPAAH